MKRPTLCDPMLARYGFPSTRGDAGDSPLDGMIAEAEAAKDWDSVLCMLGRQERLLYVAANADAIEATGRLAAVLASAWSDTNGPSQVDPSVLRALFTRAGFVTDRLGVTRPDSLLVWRGVNTPRGPGRFGYSWTTDRDKARWFGGWLAGPGGGRVYEATATIVLALLYEREESEAVVDPAGLRRIHLVERVAPLPT